MSRSSLPSATATPPLLKTRAPGKRQNGPKDTNFTPEPLMTPPRGVVIVFIGVFLHVGQESTMGDGSRNRVRRTPQSPVPSPQPPVPVAATGGRGPRPVAAALTCRMLLGTFNRTSTCR